MIPANCKDCECKSKNLNLQARLIRTHLMIWSGPIDHQPWSSHPSSKWCHQSLHRWSRSQRTRAITKSGHCSQSVSHASSLPVLWFGSYRLFPSELQKAISRLVRCIAVVAPSNCCSFHQTTDSLSPVLDPGLALRLEVQSKQHCVNFKHVALWNMWASCLALGTLYHHCHVGKARLAC